MVSRMGFMDFAGNFNYRCHVLQKKKKMKTRIKYILSFSLFLCIEVKAQDKAGTHSESPSETSAKGRKELRKDERVKRHTEKHLKAEDEKLEKHSDKPFIKKEHPKTPKGKKEEEVIRK
jgi:hypothetical protein